MTEAQQALTAAPVEEECEDAAEMCESWAAKGECDKNQGYMHKSCRRACGLCAPKAGQKDQQEASPKLDSSEETKTAEHLASTTISAT